MAESQDKIKTLKPFKEILISHEARYHKSTPGSRDLVIGEIMAAICKAAGEKETLVAGDSVLHNVSISTSSQLLQALRNALCIRANCKLLYEPLVSSKGRGGSTD